MSVSENIIMTAKNQTKAALNEMEKDTRKTAGAMKKDFSDGAGTASKRVGDLGKGLNNTVQQMTGFNLAQLGAAGAVALVAKQVGESIRFTANYAEKIRTLSAATGMNNQETAKMIQLFDDANVSEGALTQAARQLVRQGLQPSIETIANLADQYNALQDPVAKSKLLLDNFGRAGLEMGKLLDMGSEAIRESGKSAERAGQVMSDQAVAGAEEYRVALDNLSDTAEGVKIKVGTELIPVLTRGANAINNWIEATAEHRDTLDLLDKAISVGVITQEDYNEMVFLSAKGTKNLRISQAELTAIEGAYQKKMQSGIELGKIKAGMYDREAKAAEEVASATDLLKQKYNELGVVLGGTMTQAAQDYNDKQSELHVKMLELQGTIDTLSKKKWLTGEQKEQMAGAKKELAETRTEVQELAAEHDKATKQMILNFVMQAAAADEVITQQEFDKIANLGKEWGLYDQATATAISNSKRYLEDAGMSVDEFTGRVGLTKASIYDAYAMTQNMVSEWKKLNSKTITLTVKVKATGTGPGGVPYPTPGAGGATGLDATIPPGFPNDSFPVWTTSGEHITVTPQGQVGKGDGSGSGGGGVSFYIGKLNVYGAPGMDALDLADDLMDMAEQSRAAGKAGLEFAG